MDSVLGVISPRLEPLARKYADPSRRAESTTDLLQESCLRAWQKLDTFRLGRDDEETFAMFRAWIGQIVRRLGMNAQRDRMAQRRRPRGGVLDLDAAPPEDGRDTRGGFEPASAERSPSSMVSRGELAARVQEVLRRIPDEIDAEIVRGFFFDAQPISEIARKLGLGYHVIRDRHLSLLRRFEKEFEDLL